MNQLHERQTLSPKQKEMLYEEQKGNQIPNVSKGNHNGTIKSLGPADGRSQRKHTTNAEASSSRVSLEAKMMSCTIDEKEGRYVIVTDISGALLHMDMNEDVHMLLEGNIAKLIAKL